MDLVQWDVPQGNSPASLFEGTAKRRLAVVPLLFLLILALWNSCSLPVHLPPAGTPPANTPSNAEGESPRRRSGDAITDRNFTLAATAKKCTKSLSAFKSVGELACHKMQCTTERKIATCMPGVQVDPIWKDTNSWECSEIPGRRFCNREGAPTGREALSSLHVNKHDPDKPC